jgi:hypothetical protein
VTKRFERELKEIIHQGDTSKEYRNLMKRIVEIHRECFTEENFATSKDYLEELLRDALIESTRTETYQYLENLCNQEWVFFWLTKDEKYLLSSDAPIWREKYPDIHPITGKEALRKFGVENIDECTEKCIVRVAE